MILQRLIMSGYDEGLTYKVSQKFMQGVPEIHFEKLAPMIFTHVNHILYRQNHFTQDLSNNPSFLWDIHLKSKRRDKEDHEI